MEKKESQGIPKSGEKERGRGGKLKPGMLFDFEVSLPRVVVAENMAIIDNVDNIRIFEPGEITVEGGKNYITVLGENLTIKEIQEERMLIIGEVETVKLFKAGHSTKD